MRPDVVLALKQALVAALRDPAQRARAVMALRGAELWAATWPNDPSFLRTITDEERVTSLPLFSDERELAEAAARYGWLGVDGKVQGKLVHISEAVRAAMQLHAQMLVIDSASEHALSLDVGDMELLASSPSARPPSTGDLHKVVAKVRSTPPPPADTEVMRATGRKSDPDLGHYSALKPISISERPLDHAVSATFGAIPTATMASLETPPSQEMLDELSALLRNYPEVEWACMVSSAHEQDTESGDKPSVALRIEPAFRNNLSGITAKLRELSAQHGAAYDVLILENPEQMKQARHIGLPFYPWRKKSQPAL